jgi:hypothetical protein
MRDVSMDRRIIMQEILRRTNCLFLSDNTGNRKNCWEWTDKQIAKWSHKLLIFSKRGKKARNEP